MTTIGRPDAISVVAAALSRHSDAVVNHGEWMCVCGSYLHVYPGGAPGSAATERVDAAHRDHQGHAVIVALGRTHKIKARTKVAS